MAEHERALRKALKELSGSLKKAGYAPDERATIVEGAAERAADLLQDDPKARIEDAVALVASYKSPQFAPDAQSDAAMDNSLARFAWIALAAAVLGIAGLAPIVATAGGDGGTVMVLFSTISLPLAGILAYLSRRTRSGRMAGYVTICAAVAIFAVFLAGV